MLCSNSWSADMLVYYSKMMCLLLLVAHLCLFLIGEWTLSLVLVCLCFMLICSSNSCSSTSNSSCSSFLLMLNTTLQTQQIIKPTKRIPAFYNNKRTRVRNRANFRNKLRVNINMRPYKLRYNYGVLGRNEIANISEKPCDGRLVGKWKHTYLFIAKEIFFIIFFRST